MRCCRSDWLGLRLFCCYCQPTELILGFFLKQNSTLFLQPCHLFSLGGAETIDILRTGSAHCGFVTSEGGGAILLCRL